MSAEITVTVPARPEFAHVLRAVVASVAARMDLGYDVIEELRILVDEASAQLLAIREPATALRLRVIPSETAVELTVSTDAHVGRWPPERAERGLGWQVVAGLADEAVFDQWDGRAAVRLRKLASAPGGRDD
ncbi:MAG TPA: ATP-binding protein [Actinomycetota bacterium]|nr:ATP-binding protein [Actinomycetota bacterium]